MILVHFEASGVAPNTDTMPGIVYLDVSNTLELFCFFLENIFRMILSIYAVLREVSSRLGALLGLRMAVSVALLCCTGWNRNFPDFTKIEKLSATKPSSPDHF